MKEPGASRRRVLCCCRVRLSAALSASEFELPRGVSRSARYGSRRFLRYTIYRSKLGPSSRIRPPRIGLMPTGLLRATVARIDVAVA